jgi:holo-[acyl-carrier protein] synthase
MIKGIGTDIVKINRINEKIVKRVLSFSEKKLYDSFQNENRKKEFAAGRFAAKEALYKSLNISFEFKKIDILKDQNGGPYLSDKTKSYIDKICGKIKIKISISHEKKYAIAFVIVEEEVDSNL